MVLASLTILSLLPHQTISKAFPLSFPLWLVSMLLLEHNKHNPAWGHNTIRKLLTPMAKMHGCLLYLLNESFTYHLLQTLTLPPLFSPSFSDFSPWDLSTNKLDSFVCLLARL